MKALTIHQPYAELIARGEKVVENRTWPTRHRGAIAIHAGKSRDWLRLDACGERDIDYDIALRDMPMGEIVAIWSIVDCVPIQDFIARYATRCGTAHAKGPYCWVFDWQTSPSRVSIPARGQQGLWEWGEVQP